MPGVETSIFLLAENRLLREALVRIVSKKTNFRIVGATTFSTAAWEQLGPSEPDIVLSDSPDELFGAARLVSQLRASAPVAKLVLVGMERDEEQFLRAVSEGVVGYTLKDASAMEILGVIRAVANGEAVCPPSLSVALFECAARSLKRDGVLKPQADLGLSRREQQLAHYVTLGMTNKEIACKLNISDQTVKNHVHRILRKLGAKDRQKIVEIYRPELQTYQSVQTYQKAAV
jgi:two-component system, NarL family, nitrate/nitrite response regulator NarL